MNRRGQTLILFVFLIPILLLLFAFLVDLGFLNHEKIKLSGITDSLIKEYYNKEMDEKIEKEIKDIYTKNKIPIENLKIKKEEGTLEIQNEYQIESIFGKIIGLKNYKISIHKKGKQKEGQFIIEKE